MYNYSLNVLEMNKALKRVLYSVLFGSANMPQFNLDGSNIDKLDYFKVIDTPLEKVTDYACSYKGNLK